MESTHACCLKEVAEIICVHLEQCLAVQRSRSFSNLLILLNVKASVYHKKIEHTSGFNQRREKKLLSEARLHLHSI